MDEDEHERTHDTKTQYELSEAEFQAASDKHATFGAITSGAVKVDAAYILRTEEADA